jgi:hypothetical protein
MASLPRRRIKQARNRNGRLGRPLRPRLGLALGDDRGRRLAFAHEAATEAEAGDNQRNCQCNLFHGTPLVLNSSCRAIALVQPDKSPSRGARTSAEKPQWICLFDEIAPLGGGKAPFEMSSVIHRGVRSMVATAPLARPSRHLHATDEWAPCSRGLRAPAMTSWTCAELIADGHGAASIGVAV